MLYLVATAEGRPLAGNISGWPVGASASAGSLSFQIEGPGKRGEQSHPARAKLFVIPDGYRLLVGRDIGDAAAFRDRVKTTLIWSGLLALAVGLIGGSVMSRNMLRRVEEVNRTAERVIAGNLSDRVPRLGTADEFDQLAATQQHARPDQADAGIREVTDNVARVAPLARLRAARTGTSRPVAARSGDCRDRRPIQICDLRALLSIAGGSGRGSRRRTARSRRLAP
jgi:HAMP domain-containing protein